MIAPTDRRLDSEEMSVLFCNLRRHLPSRRQVVAGPDRAAMRADNQVVVRDAQIVDGHRRQVQLELPPGGTVVRGKVNATLAAEVEQPLLLWVGADDVEIVILRQTTW